MSCQAAKRGRRRTHPRARTRGPVARAIAVYFGGANLNESPLLTAELYTLLHHLPCVTSCVLFHSPLKFLVHFGEGVDVCFSLSLILCLISVFKDPRCFILDASGKGNGEPAGQLRGSPAEDSGTVLHELC